MRDGGEECSVDKDPCGDQEHCDYPGRICVHKDLFPAHQKEIWGLLALSFLMMLCTAGGIGGGVVVAPMCIAFFGFGTKEAVALSGFSILLCQLTKWVYSWK